jgi:hypothetical protein
MYAKNETLVLMLVMVVTLGVAGCGGSGEEPAFLKDLIPATGSVTLNGEPLAGANVIFVPDISVEGGRMAMAVTDESGAYELITRVRGASDEKSMGALPGEYTVAISRIEVPEGVTIPDDVSDENEVLARGAKQLVPAKFVNPETSTLKATVASPNAKNDFEL